MPVPIEPVDANAHTEDPSGAPTLATPGLGADTGVDRGTERYEFGAEVARGGMGRIVRAVDRRLDRDVAVKVMIGSSGQLAARFDREARVIARLQHPGIVPIYDIGSTEDGRPFYSMKLIEGRTLDDAIKAADADGRMELLPHVLAAVDAIAYAHSQRIIHRDLKPLNVLVGAFGETLVIDWGLAKELTAVTGDSGEEPIPAADDPTLTRHGQVVGTPAYMPPEQAAGRPVDERADVYALGAMLYHVLAGQPPFAGVDSARLMAEVATGRPKPLDELRPDLPDDLLAIVARAMAREAHGRYADAREMAADLRRHQAGQLVSAHHYTLRQRIGRFLRRNRDVVIATVAVALALAVLLSYRFIVVANERDQALEAERRAEEQRAGAEEMARFMVTDLKYRLEPIGKLSLLESVGKKADDYWRRLQQPNPGEHARAIELRGDVTRSSGNSDEALLFYAEASGYALAAGDRRLTSHIWISVGDVFQERGSIDAAERFYMAALTMGADLEPKVAANARMRLGMIAAARGDNAAALAAWKVAAAEFEALVAQHPDDLDMLYNASMAHGIAGDVLYQQNQVPEALAAFERSLALARKLSAAAPDNAEWERAVSLPLDRIAEIYRYRNELDRADAAFRETLARAEKIAARDPENPKWQSDVAISHRNVAEVAVRRDRHAEAIGHMEQALAIQGRVVELDPKNQDERRTLGSLLRVMATVQSRADHDDLALTYAGKAVALRREDMRRSPDDVWTRYYLAEILVDRGDLTGGRAGMADYREALALLEPLVAADASVSVFRGRLAQSELGIARILAAAGRAAEARPHAARALPLYEQLLAAGELEEVEKGLVDEVRRLAQ
jgi:tetratricopeptide (TPR) repeat protein